MAIPNESQKNLQKINAGFSGTMTIVFNFGNGSPGHSNERGSGESRALGNN